MRYSWLLAAAGMAWVAAASPARAADRPVLAVCADPSNLPYSNEKQEGFENRIASLLAADFHADLRYTWNQERRSFFRRTLFAGACDVVISVPAMLPTAMPKLAVTKPYFASSYVAVTRTGDTRRFTSFDDPWLRDANIGLQLIGIDGANTPPAMALTRRGINQHITGFRMWADDSVANPQGRIIEAVADGSIDVALVWGPFAGYFAKAHGAGLRIASVTTDTKYPDQIYVFPMAMGVRSADTALRDRLQSAIDRHATEIAAILHDFGVPAIPVPATAPDDHAAAAPPTR